MKKPTKVLNFVGLFSFLTIVVGVIWSILEEVPTNYGKVILIGLTFLISGFILHCTFEF